VNLILVLTSALDHLNNWEPISILNSVAALRLTYEYVLTGLRNYLFLSLDLLDSPLCLCLFAGLLMLVQVREENPVVTVLAFAHMF
jgi:hypothetical protein